MSGEYKKSHEKLSEKPEIKKLQEEKENLSREYIALTDPEKKQECIIQMSARVDAMNKERKKDPNFLSNINLENALEKESFILKDIQRNLAIQLQAKKDIPA